MSAPEMRRHSATRLEVATSVPGNALNGSTASASRHGKAESDSTARCEVGFGDCP